MAIDIKSVEKVLQLAKKHGVAEIEVEDGKNKIRVKTALGAAQIVASMPAVSSSNELPLPLSESPKKIDGLKSEDKYVKVISPFVGTFYRSPSPEADPYVKEGQMIKKGDVMCIIEAMKLMNEIESEVSGKVISVLAENGQPVEYGEPLYLIDPVR